MSQDGQKQNKAATASQPVIENTWKENFSYNFSMRNKMISQVIDFSRVSSILDLGCGQQDLRLFVPENVSYTGYDLYQHKPSTIIRDFNNGDTIQDDADVAVCSGFIEYIRDPEAMIADICTHCSTVVGSYNFTDDVPERSSIWVNALSKSRFDSFFRKNGFRKRAEIFRGDDTLFAYSRAGITPPLCNNYLNYINNNINRLISAYKTYKLLSRIIHKFEKIRIEKADAIRIEINWLTNEWDSQKKDPDKL